MSLLLSQLGAKNVAETVGVSGTLALSSSDRLLRILKVRKEGFVQGPGLPRGLVPSPAQRELKVEGTCLRAEGAPQHVHSSWRHPGHSLVNTFKEIPELTEQRPRLAVNYGELQTLRESP